MKLIQVPHLDQVMLQHADAYLKSTYEQIITDGNVRGSRHNITPIERVVNLIEEAGVYPVDQIFYQPLGISLKQPEESLPAGNKLPADEVEKRQEAFNPNRLHVRDFVNGDICNEMSFSNYKYHDVVDPDQLVVALLQFRTLDVDANQPIGWNIDFAARGFVNHLFYSEIELSGKVTRGVSEVYVVTALSELQLLEEYFNSNQTLINHILETNKCWGRSMARRYSR